MTGNGLRVGVLARRTGVSVRTLHYYARIREVEAEWPRLIAEMKFEMEAGTDPAGERVQELTRRWQALVAEFTGGNPEIAATVKRMYENEPEVRDRAGVDPALFEYVSRAIAAGNRA